MVIQRILSLIILLVFSCSSNVQKDTFERNEPYSDLINENQNSLFFQLKTYSEIRHDESLNLELNEKILDSFMVKTKAVIESENKESIKVSFPFLFKNKNDRNDYLFEVNTYKGYVYFFDRDMRYGEFGIYNPKTNSIYIIGINDKFIKSPEQFDISEVGKISFLSDDLNLDVEVLYKCGIPIGINEYDRLNLELTFKFLLHNFSEMHVLKSDTKEFDIRKLVDFTLIPSDFVLRRSCIKEELIWFLPNIRSMPKLENENE
jgi:hypothetical protein